MADRKLKARGVPTRKIPSPPKPEKSQSERFIEAAREAGVTDEGFDKALSKVAPPKGSAKDS